MSTYISRSLSYHPLLYRQRTLGTNGIDVYRPDAIPVTKPHCQLVSWSLTSLFSTNMAISETKGQGGKVIRSQ